MSTKDYSHLTHEFNEEYETKTFEGCKFLARNGISAKDDLLLLARIFLADPDHRGLLWAIEEEMERSQGPNLRSFKWFRDEVRRCLERCDLCDEWAVYMLLDAALEFAEQAPTRLEALYPFTRAVAAVVDKVDTNKGLRDEHWIAQFGAGDMSLRGPATEPPPSWVDAERLKAAESEYRKSRRKRKQNTGGDKQGSSQAQADVAPTKDI